MIEWLAPQCSDAQSDAADASGPDPSNRRFSSETEQHACAGGDGCRGDQRFTQPPLRSSFKHGDGDLHTSAQTHITPQQTGLL